MENDREVIDNKKAPPDMGRAYMSSVHLELLRIIQDFQWIDIVSH